MKERVENTVYHFAGSNLRAEVFLKKKKHQKKGAFEVWGVSVHFVLGFPFATYTFVLHLWLLVSKVKWGIRTTSEKQWKIQKVEIRWATFVKKIHSKKTHQISYVIFKTISYFWWQNFSIFFHLKHYNPSTKVSHHESANFQTFNCSC